MTTQVKVEIVQAHMPVVVEVMSGDRIINTVSLDGLGNGAGAVEYVHSGQWLRVREKTTEEVHRERT